METVIFVINYDSKFSIASMWPFPHHETYWYRNCLRIHEVDILEMVLDYTNQSN